MNFTELVRKSHFYFKDPKLPTDGTMDIWVEEAGRYPGEFYDWAFVQLKAGKKSSLENFPQTIYQLWQRWLEKNPRKVDRSEGMTCAEKYCEDGLLFVLDSKGQSYAMRCAACNLADFDYATIRKAYMADLIEEGWIPSTFETRKRFVTPYDPNLWRKRQETSGFKWEEE
jgi:hypothetical protein